MQASFWAAFIITRCILDTNPVMRSTVVLPIVSMCSNSTCALDVCALYQECTWCPRLCAA